jgi:hypothetical protein
MAIWNKAKKQYFRGGGLFEVVMIADADGNVGGSNTPPISLPTGQSHINKFGYTGTDVNGTATIWDANGTTSLYPYPTSGVVSITSSSGSDTGEAVEVQGLDGDFNQVTETINVGASGSVTFSRVFRARKVDASNIGIVSINVGGSLAAQILAGNGQTLMAVYTIPAGFTGHLLKFQGSSDKASAVRFKLFARPTGSAFNLKGQWGTQGGNPITYDYPVPISFAEKTDLRIDVFTSSNCGCGAVFDILLVRND